MPEDIHQFCHWHHEIGAALADQHCSYVIGDGNWVVHLMQKVTCIEGSYLFPICLTFIALPLEHHTSICLFSSSLVNGFPDISAPHMDSTFEGAT